tara:strand:- start:142 stop:351 length:210 start_codon:yes stop_codon:yes gene_type:complete
VFIDPYSHDDLKHEINTNIKRIEEISKSGDNITVGSEIWFEAWNLVKKTAELIERLSAEARTMDNRLDN